MAGPNRPEVPLIQSRDFVDAEPLRQGDHRRVRGPQRQVVVLRDELRHPGEVFGNQGHRFEVAISDGLKERCLNPRTNSLLQQVAHLSNNSCRDQQPPARQTQSGEQVDASAVVGIGAHCGRDQRPRVARSRAGRAEASGKDLVNALGEVRTAVLIDPHAEESRRPGTLT